MGDRRDRKGELRVGEKVVSALGKWSRVWGTRNAGSQGGGSKAVTVTVGTGSVGEMTFECRPEGSEGADLVQSILGLGRTCLGPGVVGSKEVVRLEWGHVRGRGGHRVRRQQARPQEESHVNGCHLYLGVVTRRGKDVGQVQCSPQDSGRSLQRRLKGGRRGGSPLVH